MFMDDNIINIDYENKKILIKDFRLVPFEWKVAILKANSKLVTSTSFLVISEMYDNFLRSKNI